MNIGALLEKTITFLLLGSLLSYLGGAVFRSRERLVSGGIALVAMAGSLFYALLALPMLFDGSQTILLYGFLPWNVDLLGWIVAVTGLVLSFAVTLYSLVYMEEDTGTGKFFPLLLLLVISVVGLCFSLDLFNLYLFFELLSISSFALVAFRKNHWEPVEAGIKFMVMSVTGSALILLGIALVYMEFGSLDLNILTELAGRQMNIYLWAPLACFTVGFGVKAAMFPLHTWLPDAHAEAPSGISAMLSGIIIEVGFFALLRLYFALGTHFAWGEMLIWFALITMTAGNLMALTQKHIKRMLAYSSVAQMGYILLGIGIGVTYNVAAGTTGGIFHIVTHAFMKGLAFLCAGALIFRLGTAQMSEMRGAGWRMPLTGIGFTIAVLSLAGVPPFAGFMSKLLIYQSGIQSAATLGWVASFIAILNSVFSLGYYLPAVGILYDRNASPRVNSIKEAPFAMSAALVVLAGLTIYLGIMPEPVRNWVEFSFELINGAF